MTVIIDNNTPHKECDSCGRKLFDDDVSCVVCEWNWRLNLD